MEVPGRHHYIIDSRARYTTHFSRFAMTPTTDRRLKQLTVVAWLEGISYIILLFVAMPLKYLAGQPEMVRSVGMAHGVLFVLFIAVAVLAKVEHDWSGRRLFRVLLTTFIPFGMIAIHKLWGAPERVR